MKEKENFLLIYMKRLSKVIIMAKHNLQKIITEIIIESKKNGLDYITNKQIYKQVSIIKPDLENVESNVKNALYLLKHKEKKWNEPKIIRTKDGWTVEKIIKPGVNKYAIH